MHIRHKSSTSAHESDAHPKEAAVTAHKWNKVKGKHLKESTYKVVSCMYVVSTKEEPALIYQVKDQSRYSLHIPVEYFVTCSMYLRRVQTITAPHANFVLLRYKSYQATRYSVHSWIANLIQAKLQE